MARDIAESRTAPTEVTDSAKRTAIGSCLRHDELGICVLIGSTVNAVAPAKMTLQIVRSEKRPEDVGLLCVTDEKQLAAEFTAVEGTAEDWIVSRETPSADIEAGLGLQNHRDTEGIEPETGTEAETKPVGVETGLRPLDYDPPYPACQYLCEVFKGPSRCWRDTICESDQVPAADRYCRCGGLDSIAGGNAAWSAA